MPYHAGAVLPLTLSAFHDDYGAFAGCRGVAVDVTEQTLKEIMLNWQRAVIEEGRDFVRIFDMEGHALYTNPGVYKMTGYDLAFEAPPSDHLYTPEHYKTVYGKGSKFIFTVKVKGREGKPLAKLHGKIGAKGIRILAVDDSKEIREYFTHTMNTLGLQCDVAADALQAIRMVKESRDDPYSIFFVDWQMPGMDGIELTQEIKKINGEGSVAIMISANDWNAVEKEAIGAGVDYFISKPLFLSTLFGSNPAKYDLILMDINMPEMDGYEATRQIRALPFTEAKTIPIIII